MFQRAGRASCMCDWCIYENATFGIKCNTHSLPFATRLDHVYYILKFVFCDNVNLILKLHSCHSLNPVMIMSILHSLFHAGSEEHWRAPEKSGLDLQ